MSNRNYNDKIIIKDLKLFAYHGVNAEEKRDGQNFFISLFCSLDMKKSYLTDNIEDTVSYAKIIKLVRLVFQEKSYDLIERAAYVVLEAVFKEYPQILELRIVLKKPEAPMKADFSYVAVDMTRTREDFGVRY